MKEFVLKNKAGERMAIRVYPENTSEGILILLDREETSGPFLVTLTKHFR